MGGKFMRVTKTAKETPRAPGGKGMPMAGMGMGSPKGASPSPSKGKHPAVVVMIGVAPKRGKK